MTRTLPLTVGLLQFDVKKGDLKSNMDTVSKAAKDACERGVDWLLLPELFSSSYDLENAAKWGEINQREVLPEMAGLAGEYRIAIAGSYMLPLSGGGIGNTLVWIDDTGHEAGRYTKLHRFKPMNEDQYLTPGRSPVLVESPFGKVGLSICYDLRFPELYRFYQSEGARFIVLPSQWPNPRLKHFKTLVTARAIENQVVMLAVNRVGAEGDHTFFGHSMVIDPWGETICDARDEEILLVCMFDPAEISKVRRDFPVADDIRHDVWNP
ncbi:MAG: carbon-nitrogen family hydrolase [Deltaproteobacteria bacterium]|nr:MAG: carbon-nitrogen family hydrolase [Deltaproteobacteria bacterium]